MIEVVLWDCGHMGSDPSRARLNQLCALGIDVLVVSSAEKSPAEVGGPGRVLAWSGPVADSGGSPESWARRCLVGVGGPDAVLTVTDEAQLDDLVAAHTTFPPMVEDDAWTLEVGGFGPRREGDVEAWLAVGNGRTGTRGSVEEGNRASSPAVFVAGVFGCVPGDPNGPELAPGPEWAHLDPRLDGDAVDLETGETTEHHRVLDLRQAIVFREWRQRLPSDRQWSFRSARFASLADREILALQAEAEGGSLRSPGSSAGEIPLPAPTGAVASANLSYVNDHQEVTVHASGGGEVSFAIADDGDEGRLERLVAVGRVRPDVPDDHVGPALARARAAGMATVRADHRQAWRKRWRSADVVVVGDPAAQEALRFSLYHLISAADPESDLASVGARALTGPGYRGHVFWDTEVFVLPFFIWTHPPSARALLAYRYRTLPQARAKAARFGYAGALFPWESADTGEEVTPTTIDLPDGTKLTILTGVQEHHISADIAWATWQYWQATADDEFLVTMGAEIIVETARLWASRTRQDDEARHHIDEVIGPDEYHEGVDDNAYTNVLARWNLRAAVEVCALVPTIDAKAWTELASRLDLAPSEVEQWEAAAAGLVDGFDPETKLYEQFAGFFGLESIRAVDLAPRPFTGEMVVGVERLRHTQIVKQADVVMLAHLLPNEVPPDVARVNYEYYEPRTCHGSSLSPAIHAAVAARIGALDEAVDYFRAAAGLDLHDHMGNAAKGVHIATMGGLWQAAVFGFGGVQPSRDGVRIDPHLPPGWEKLAFPLCWRGTQIDVEVTADGLLLHLDGPAAVAVGDGEYSQLRRGSFLARRQGDTWSDVVDSGG